MEGLSPIFSDYKLVKIIDMATYKIDAGVTQMKQKQINSVQNLCEDKYSTKENISD